MKKILLPFFLLLVLQSQAQDLQKLYTDAMAAYKAKDYGKFYEHISEAHKVRPSHQGILYQLGIAAALTNHNN